MIRKKYISFIRAPKVMRRVFILCAIISGALNSCNSDDIVGDAYYTFVGETVASFCDNNPQFSTFARLIHDTGNYSLLSVYGHFTCFAPTDDAFSTYFSENGMTYDALSDAKKQEILYNHIIRSDSYEYTYEKFQEGAISTPNMRDRFIVVAFNVNDQGQREIVINKNSTITDYNNELHNGVLHVIDRVITMSEEDLPSVIRNDSQNRFTIFSQALDATGLGDTMQEIYNDSYESPYAGGTGTVDIGGWTFKVPDKDKLGYTVFCEPDELFKRNNITDLNSLRDYAANYYGREDWDDYTSSKNPVNKFISYHILNRQMATNSFIYQGAATTPTPEAQNKRYEYYETLLQYRLIEIKPGTGGYQLNTSTADESKCVTLNEQQSNISGVNGFIHVLNDILVYDENYMTSDVLNKRIRFDAYAVPPQLTNNNIRWQLVDMQGNVGYSITPDFCGDYLTFNDASNIKLWASESWTNHQADEMIFTGWYDFTLRLLPVPPGSYEIRLGYRAESWRGIAQLFIDGDIQGIPVNLRTIGTDPGVGWVADSETADNGSENDKAMRNRGYMKAPASVYSLNGPKTLRDDSYSLRIVIGTFSFQEYAPHYFRVKNVETNDREFHLDYIEYIPTNLIETEDIN